MAESSNMSDNYRHVRPFFFVSFLDTINFINFNQIYIFIVVSHTFLQWG